MEVGVYGLFEVFNLGVIPERNDISVLNVNVQFVLLGKVVEFVLKIFPIFNVSVKAEDGPFLEVDRLVHKLVKDPGVVKSSSRFMMRIDN